MGTQPVRYNTGLKYNRGVVYNGTVSVNSNPNIAMATSTDTPVVINLTSTQKAAILAKIAELAALMPWTIGLSDDERRALPKLGEKTVGWDEKVASYMANRPDLVPSYVDMATLVQNRQARVDLADIMRPLGDVWQRVNDTDMKVGSQIYKPERAFYNNCQEASKHGVNGSQAIVDDLKSRFAGQGQHAQPATKTQKPAA